MYGTVLNRAEKKTTVAPRIVRIILNDLAMLDRRADLSGANHPIRFAHLPYGMRQEQDFSLGASPDQLQCAIVLVHDDDTVLESREIFKGVKKCELAVSRKNDLITLFFA